MDGKTITLFVIFRYFASLSMPMTLAAPLSKPTANIAPEPTNGSGSTSPGGRMYLAYQDART
jgi:hypothetical protein